MRTRKLRIILAALLLFAASGIAYHTLAAAASKKGSPKKKTPKPVVLCKKSLKAGMQGYSGTALDLNGDGYEDLVVGAPYARHKDTYGALLVYLSDRKGFHKNPSGVLKGEGNLGWSLAALGDVYGDGKTYFAAGAHNGSGAHVSLSGTVSVYEGGKKPERITLLEGENAMDRYGYALAAGYLNADEYPDLVVGAPMHSPSPDLYQKGAVYVYFGPDYSPENALKISATAANGGIGFSLATGDINGDGADDLLMEAAGKVIGFLGGVGFPSCEDFPSCDDFPSGDPDVSFMPSGRPAGFGRSIAVIWDVDEDGYNDVAVGAYKATIGPPDNVHTGRLYILRGGTLVDPLPPLSLLAAVDGEEKSGQFGAAILPVTDFDDDGVPDLAVSAVHGDGDPWLMTGKIYLLSGSSLIDLNDPPDLALAKTILGEEPDMHLGTFLAPVAQGNCLAAGAPTEASNTGTVRIFDLALEGND